MDVLENGEASGYAAFFDIDWAPSNPDRAHKVLVPVLADPYGTVLERGELELRFEPHSGSFAVYYRSQRLPLDPRTYPRILDRVAALVANTELENTRRALAELPDRQALAPEQVAERCREKERHKQRLAALAAGNPEAGAARGRCIWWSRRSPPHSSTCRRTGRCTARPVIASPTSSTACWWIPPPARAWTACTARSSTSRSSGGTWRTSASSWCCAARSPRN